MWKISMDKKLAKEQAVKSGILLYYNQVLLDKNLITEQEYRQMIRLINEKYPVFRR